MIEAGSKSAPMALRRIRDARLSGWLMILTIGVAGLERIDLFGGQLGFRLTPFLVLLPVTLIVLALQGAYARVAWRSLPRWQQFGSFAAALFVLAAAASSFLAPEIGASRVRVTLLVVLVIGGWALVMGAVRLGGPKTLFAGSALGLALFVAFDLVQLVAHWMGYDLEMGAGGFVDLGTHPFGDELIRLSGGTLDANRAALLVGIYAFFLLVDPWSARGQLRRRNALIVLLITGFLVLATFSRSGAIVFLFIALGAVKSIFPMITWRRIAVWGLSAAVVVITAVLLIMTLWPHSQLGEVLTSRLGIFTDGSALEHFGLYGEGFRIFAEHPDRAVTGVGYGNTYLYLGDTLGQTYFGSEKPTNYYTMFHSSYLTILVEMGLLGLVALLALTLTPIASRRGLLALGMGLFGVFYQSLSDPIYWIAVAMLWLAPGSHHGDENDVARAESGDTTTTLGLASSSSDADQRI